MNRIKIVLLEKELSSKWLALKMKKTHTTVSRWCTNTMQPSLRTLFVIADVLDVDVRLLLEANK